VDLGTRMVDYFILEPRLQRHETEWRCEGLLGKLKNGMSHVPWYIPFAVQIPRPIVLASSLSLLAVDLFVVTQSRA